MTAINKEYLEHHIFNQLDVYAKFYEALSLSVFSFTSRGTRSIFNIDSYVFSSIKGTIESINNILQSGRINDAYALLRKYYDSTVINIYSNLYLEDHFSIDNFIVQKIDDWLRGKEQMPEYRIMSKYIKTSSKLSPITDLLDSDKRYKDLRQRCNDHTHYNFYQNVLLNDNEIYSESRIPALGILAKDIEDVFIFHIAYLFYLNEHYMMSSDYADDIDCGAIPVEGTQYFVAPFIQKIFDTVLRKNRADIASQILSTTSMKLE